jgi:probable HAF family extracellular repeat protein
MKRSYKAWALVLGGVLSTQTFAGKWLYTVQNAQIDLLPSPFKVGGFSEARDINIHGQIVGWAETSGPKPNAWLYEPSGVYKNVGIPLTDTEARAVSINNLGEVVGTWVDNAMRRGFYWHPSTGFASLATEL